jgi:hypothetical protein
LVLADLGNVVGQRLGDTAAARILGRAERMRIGARWSDACILNISSRGLMIRSASRIAEGSVVELRRGEHVIHGRVVWKDGAKAGLQSDERLPVDDILTLSQSPSLQLTAADSQKLDRRGKPRPIYQDSRLRAHVVQFVGTLVIAAGLSAAVLSMVERAMVKPLALVELALGG